MRYLITGGAGFIGSHLAEELLSRGQQVILLDNLSTGRADNVEHLTGKVDFHHGSVMDGLLVDELVEQSDIVVHLAAAVGVKLVVEQPLKSLLTNIRGSETVLEAAHRYRRKILIASTSEIYGKNEKQPFKEDDDRLLGSIKVVRWGYSTSKAVDEILAYAYHRERNLPTVVVRLFNTVGPRQSGAYGMVVPRLVGQAISGEPMTVFGDGSQSRCFCHVKDVIDGMLRLLDEPKAEGDVFNLGSTEEVSILSLAERIKGRTRSTSEIRFVPYDQAYESGFEDMKRRVPDTTKVCSLTGWEPVFDLDSIVDDVVLSLSTSR